MLRFSTHSILSTARIFILSQSARNTTDIILLNEITLPLAGVEVIETREELFPKKSLNLRVEIWVQKQTN